MTGVRKTGSAREVRFEPAPLRALHAPAAPEPVDEAPITEEARELSRALQSVLSAPDVRALRIAALRQAIANGTYSPNPREIARRLMERGGFAFDEEEPARR